MGSLILPNSGTVYVDANIVIYSVEAHPRYMPLLIPLWSAIQNGVLEVGSSDLILLETLVEPLRRRNAPTIANYELFWHRPNTRLLPITQDILREAARLRAEYSSHQSARRNSCRHRNHPQLLSVCDQ